ncbi:hypothetical protein [Candidatus Poriferisocius sp.]|uniref:hypothetical protein n=1 Tax=Candidatus Poriferisocius sp. TaxID=3101276 RepID=UPI003B01CEA3
MQLRQEQLGIVLRHARWIQWQAAQISEAHDLGHGPGEHTDSDSEKFRRQARDVYELTLPPHQVELIAESFEHCAGLMELMQPDNSVTEEWNTIISYLRSISKTSAGDSGHPMAVEWVGSIGDRDRV